MGLKYSWLITIAVIKSGRHRAPGSGPEAGEGGGLLDITQRW